jgi:hypothetical protein
MSNVEGNAAENNRHGAGDEFANVQSRSREQSTIVFPYNDLESAISTADILHSNAGQSCTTEQLAAYAHQTADSGAFRLRLSTARIFGLILTDRGRISLTELGGMVVDPARRDEGKVKAFFAVPLYHALYDRYKGGLLPPPVALAREIVGLGVAAKQADRARQAFDRSAMQAGFFAHGRDRLVMPVVSTPADAPKPETVAREEPKIKSSSNDGGSGQPPFVQFLLAKLPEPDSEWPLRDRVKWLQTAASMFDLAYKVGDEAEEAEIKVEIRKTGI